MVIGTNVYLFGSNSSNYQKYAYKYNTKTNSYTKLTDIPYKFYNGSAVAIGTNGYLFGSDYSDYASYAYKYEPKVLVYPEINKYKYDYIKVISSSPSSHKLKTIYILTGTQNITLSKILQTNISKAYIYQNNKIQEYPCYYGDGTKWNLIN